METLDAVFTRRSVRAFTAEPVPDELLHQMLRAGAASASGGNVQLEEAIRAERFGHSDDQQLRAALNELCLRYAAELKERYSTKEEDKV